MAESTFLYVTYIRTTPDALWHALTDSDFIPQFWLGVRAEAEWKVGGAWSLVTRRWPIDPFGVRRDMPRR